MVFEDTIKSRGQPVIVLRLADFFIRLEARLSFAIIGLVQAASYAGGLGYVPPRSCCYPWSRWMR